MGYSSGSSNIEVIYVQAQNAYLMEKSIIPNLGMNDL
jgi:hypothetical protein